MAAAVRQLTNTCGLPAWLVSRTGPYEAEKNPCEPQVPGPDDFVNGWLLKSIELSAGLAVPGMLVAWNTHVTAPKIELTTIVVCSGAVELDSPIVTGAPQPSLTVALYGRFCSLNLCPPLRDRMLPPQPQEP